MTRRHEDSDDDTYVTLGTAFEKLETIEDVEKAKRKKDKEQYVTDDRGRRRFHGAFTGGFSAGYFNTVGSEEGWTPSNFKSSKGKKQFTQQRPEDFMDKEDLGDHGIAPRAVSARESFDRKESQSVAVGPKRDAGSLRSVIPGAPPLQNLVLPARSTIGVVLLKAMGWKEGQGVGPKITKYTSSGEGPKKVYRCSLSGEQEGDGASIYPKEAEGFLFAPTDVAPWEFEGKDDMHGIGYQGIQQDHGVLGARKATKSLYGMSGEAFGVGALEDDEEDEDNVYGVEALTSYDSALAAEGDIAMERKFGWTGGLQTGEWGLSSFKKAFKQTIDTQKYPGPVVPRDFLCVHKFPASSGHQSTDDTKHKPLTSTARSQMLSDKPDSVFSLLSYSDQEKLRHVAEQVKSGRAPSSSEMKKSERREPNPREYHHHHHHHHHHHRQEERHTIQAFHVTEIKKPFPGNSEKQARYEAFTSGSTLPAPDYRMTEWERHKEEEEFVKVAKIFQPLSSSLSSRFIPAEEGKKKEEPPERPLTPESDAVQAAKANMFGLLTREMHDWHPHKTLCKRFDIPDPYPNSSIVGVASEKDKARERGSRSINFLHTQRIMAVEDNKSIDDEDKSSRVVNREDISSQSRVTIEQSGNKDPSTSAEVKTAEEDEIIERPPMDLFKTIFAESSSEDDSSDSETETITTTNKMSREIEDSKLEKTKWQDLSTIANTILPPTKNHKSSFDRHGNRDLLMTNEEPELPKTLAQDRDRNDRSNYGNQHDRYHHQQQGNRDENRDNTSREHRHGDTREGRRSLDARESSKTSGRGERGEEKISARETTEMSSNTIPMAYGPPLPPDLSGSDAGGLSSAEVLHGNDRDDSERGESKRHKDDHHHQSHHKHKEARKKHKGNCKEIKRKKHKHSKQ